jgi:hypothetical protein
MVKPGAGDFGCQTPAENRIIEQFSKIISHRQPRASAGGQKNFFSTALLV